MDVTDAKLIDVLDQSQVAEARRKVSHVAAEHGFDQKNVDRVALVVTELATNLVKHTAGGGHLLVQGLTDGACTGLELFSLDDSFGMDADACMKDGYSTTGTLGTGLGAIKRLSDSFNLYSKPNSGTVIQTRFWLSPKKSDDQNFGGLTVPKHGEFLSGDKWVIAQENNGTYCLLVDGLGHGFEAAEASKLAVTRFKENLALSPASMLEVLHKALRGSRGAVAAVAKIDTVKRTLGYAGLGNISGILVNNSDSKHLVSMNGTLGYEARKINEFTLPWSAESWLIMHSDGLSSKVAETLERLDTSAPIIAASLYLRQGKAIDDATVLVVKQSGP